MTTRATTNGNGTTLPTGPLYVDVGAPQHIRRGGTNLYDDYLTQLSGRRALKIYEEMGNDATVASLLFAIEMIARETPWHAEPADDTPQAQQDAEFLEANLANVEQPWEDIVAHALSAVQYGWSFQEIRYERTPDGPMWASLEPRLQKSMLEWVLDERNIPLGLKQEARGTPIVLPLSKGLYFRTDRARPEGRSWLRAAYRPWYFKKKAEETLMIGFRRNLMGMPVMDTPGAVIAAGAGNANYDNAKKIVNRAAVDEQYGGLVPSDVWPATNQRMYDLRLVAPQGDPHFDQGIQVVRMWATDILQTSLAQWQGLGRDSVGSRALAEPLAALFSTAVDALLDQLEETMNRGIVRQLFEFRPGTQVLPRLKHGEINKPDPAKVGAAAKDFAQALAVLGNPDDPDDPITMQALELLGFDRPDEIGSVSKLREFNKALERRWTADEVADYLGVD